MDRHDKPQSPRQETCHSCRFDSHTTPPTQHHRKIEMLPDRHYSIPSYPSLACLLPTRILDRTRKQPLDMGYKKWMGKKPYAFSLRYTQHSAALVFHASHINVTLCSHTIRFVNIWGRSKREGKTRKRKRKRNRVFIVHLSALPWTTLSEHRRLECLTFATARHVASIAT